MNDDNPSGSGFPEGFTEEEQFPYEQNVLPVLSEPSKPIIDLKILIVVAAVVVFVIAIVSMAVVFGGGNKGGADSPIIIAKSYI